MMRLTNPGWRLAVAGVLGAVFAGEAAAVRLPRIELLRDVHGSPPTADWPEGIAAPGRLAASHDLRPLTVDEVIAVIQRALAQKSPPVIESFSAEDVLLQSQIRVAKGDAGLRVLSGEFDAGIKRARFLLRASGDRNALPFYVTLSPSYGLASGLNVGRIVLDSPAGLPVTNAKGKRGTAEVLVSPEQSATLALQSTLVSMTADVIPLEKGIMGQWVRVRVSDTGKVFRARVDGRAHLAAQF